MMDYHAVWMTVMSSLINGDSVIHLCITGLMMDYSHLA